MTNQEIDKLIEQVENHLRFQFKLESAALWIVAGFFLLLGLLALLSGAGYAALLIVSACGLASLGAAQSVAVKKKLEQFEAFKPLFIWRKIYRDKVFGTPIKGLALGFRDIIEEIYSTDAGEFLLPLSQAVRLFDIYVRQQRQFNPINSRLISLYALRQPFVTKSAQLQSFGETHEKSPQERQLDAEIEWAEEAHYQIESSCNRLEKLIEGVNREAQARELRLELEEMKTQLPAAASSVEPAFASESLEEIERQIGREIETYLQLERETEEHLR